MQFSFISGLESRCECTLTKFEDEPKLGEEVAVLEEKVTTQRPQWAVEIWPAIMKFNMRLSRDRS